jgi:hypothetical protein
MMNDKNTGATAANSSPVNKLLLGASLGFQVGLLAMTWAFASDDAPLATEVGADIGAYWQGVYLWTALIMASLGLTGLALTQKEENLKAQIIVTAAFAASAVALSMGTIILTVIYGGFAVFGTIKIVQSLRAD